LEKKRARAAIARSFKTRASKNIEKKKEKGKDLNGSLKPEVPAEIFRSFAQQECTDGLITKERNRGEFIQVQDGNKIKDSKTERRKVVGNARSTGALQTIRESK